MGIRRANPWLVLVIVGLAQFMVVLDATVVNVALPSIQRALHFSTGSLEWVVNAYALTFGGFLLLGGRAGDLFGRRRLFAIGIALFSLASLLNGFAGTSAELVAGRALQGIGGALVSPAALSVLMTTFAEGRQRVRAMAVWSAVAVGGGAIGLVLGGVLTQLASWQWVFFVNVPVGVATLFLAARYVPESRAVGAEGRVDVAGAVAVTAGLMTLVYAIVNAQTAGWTSGSTLGFAAVAAALLGLFVVLEARRRHPLIRLGIFRMRSLSGANAVMLLVAAGMFAVFFFASLYVQDVLGFSPLRAGFAFLPMTGMIVIGAGVSQALIRRVGVREVAMVGMAMAAAGMLLLSLLPVNGSYAINLLPGLLVMSLGMGLTFVPVTLMATTNVEARDAGVASGLLNTAQQIGGALGLAVLSTLAANTTARSLAVSHAAGVAAQHAALVDGFRVAFLVGAVLLVAGVALLRALLRGRDVARIEAREEEAVAA
jgi:EmrB/QacA subfamily drug resistance transporter